MTIKLVCFDILDEYLNTNGNAISNSDRPLSGGLDNGFNFHVLLRTFSV